jgi:hypothetical protein
MNSLTTEEIKERLPVIVHQTKYLKFVLIKYKTKTKVYAVVSVNHGDELGRIEWFPRWRQYCFMPFGMTVWNTGCLDDIQKFLNVLMETRRPKPKTIGVVCRDMHDFLQWSRQKKHKRPANSTLRKYTIRTTTYIGFSQPTQTKGYGLDKIVETQAAHLNPNYHTLMRDIQYCLNKPF